jgi:diguanylate cyclase (GGDEF)-like protein/PAS domain S-box-containing protein
MTPASEQADFVERRRAEITLHAISDGVVSTDEHGKVSFMNPAAARITGWPPHDAVGRLATEVMNSVDAVTREPLPGPMARALLERADGALRRDTILVRRDGTEATIEDSIAPIHAADGRLCGAVMVFRDVTAARLLQLRLAHLAHHDALTGLPNRTLLQDRVEQAIGRARRHGGRVGMLFVDLDRFKRINDVMGHATGDLLLQCVAHRLMATVRSTDTVSRRGGDEFIVLMPDIADAHSAALQAERILQVMAPPHAIGARRLRVTASIGISIFPDDATEVDALLRTSDVAMYGAKQLGRNNYRFFERESHAALMDGSGAAVARRSRTKRVSTH